MPRRHLLTEASDARTVAWSRLTLGWACLTWVLPFSYRDGTDTIATTNMKTLRRLLNQASTTPATHPVWDRRDFLKAIGILPAAVAAARITAAESAPARADEVLPQVQFGKVRLARLLVGGNPFNAGSHLSIFVNKEMRQYYTPEQILKTLRRCQEVGINAWQASGGNVDLYRRFIEAGGRMHYLSLGRDPEDIAPLVRGGCLGIAHHGEVTDQLFKAGQLDRVQDYLKRVREAGLMVGVSTHIPAVVDAIESKGWDLDFYMCCVYERHRSSEELKQLLGHVPIPAREVYLESDPPRMFEAIRRTRRPCLAFKILAAGRLSERPAWVEAAFRQTFQSIKPGDAVIVGIYDKFSDQPAEDAAYTRRFGSSAS